MKVDPHIMFSKEKSRWPSAFSIIGRGEGDNGVLLSPCIVEFYNSIESEIDPENHWEHLSSWSLNQAIFSYGKRIDELGVSNFSIEDIPFGLFDEMMRMNLSDDSWSFIRKDYPGF